MQSCCAWQFDTPWPNMVLCWQAAPAACAQSFCAATLLIRLNSFEGDDPLWVNASWMMCEAITLLSAMLAGADQYLRLDLMNTTCIAPTMSIKSVQAYINARCQSGGWSADNIGFSLQARLCATSLGRICQPDLHMTLKNFTQVEPTTFRWPVT